MTFGFVHSLQNIWPFTLFKYDDLKLSDELVGKLSIPDNTKRFVYAVRVPENQAVIYVLAVQNLSERSSIDAECLIKEIRPDAVVAQVSSSAISEIISEENDLETIPTSSLEVIRRCLVDKINKDKYENLAGNLVMREVFGVSFHGHLLAAKRAAREAGSPFMVLDSQFIKTSVVDNPSEEVEAFSKVSGLFNSLLTHNVGAVVSSCTKRLGTMDDVQLRMVKMLSSQVDLLVSNLSPSAYVSDVGLKNIQPRDSYEVPRFAESIYPLLVDLHDIFIDLQSIGRALARAQDMLSDVSEGKAVDTRTISEVHTFRVAIEGLRIALNNAARLPASKTRNVSSGKVDFSELSVDEKSHALLAQALQSHAKESKTIVALVDASSAAGLRKHWKTPVPQEVKDLVEELVSDCKDDGVTSNSTNRKRLISDKQVVAVGAGATAVLGASSLSKVVPLSTFMKLVTFKVPVSLNLILTQTHKTMAMVLTKGFGSSKIVAPGLASSGAKTTSIMKGIASTEKIRAVTHSLIASVEKTSLSAMRTAFYEIMRKRRVRPISGLPLATFGCSVVTCAGLLMHGEGIECAAESLPSAPLIANLGRGIQNLHQASQTVRQIEGNRIHKSIESLMYRLKKVKIQ